MRARRYWALGGLAAVYAVTRLCFLSTTPYEWDSVNYIFAIGDFSIPDARPHFPGYIFYVALGKMANAVVHNPFRALLAVNFLTGLSALFALYRIGKLLHSGLAGVAAAALFVLNPLAWFYGEVAEIYLAEAALSGWVGFLLLKYHKTPKHASLLWPSFALGLAGGFRSNLPLFLFPLWALAVYKRRPGLPLFLASAGLAGLGTAAWAWPTLNNCGGLGQYLALSDTVVVPFLEEHSLFYGAPARAALKALVKLAALGSIYFGVPVFAGVLAARRTGPGEDRKSGLYSMLAAWTLPALFFFSFFYLGKPGYLLFLLPPALGWSAVSLTRLFPDARRLAVAVAVVSLPGVAYLFSSGVEGRETQLRLGRGGKAVHAFQRLFRYTLNDIRFADRTNLKYADLVGASLASGEGAVFVFTNFAEWRFRQGTYYFPKVESHFFRFGDDYRQLNHVQHFYGRLFDLTDNAVEVRGRPLFLFASDHSAHGRQLAGWGVRKLRADAEAYFFPEGTVESLSLRGPEVRVAWMEGVVYPR